MSLGVDITKENHIDNICFHKSQSCTDDICAYQAGWQVVSKVWEGGGAVFLCAPIPPINY